MRRTTGVAFALLIVASAIAFAPSAAAAADPPIVRADPARVELVAGSQFRGFLTVTSRSDFGDAFDVNGIAASPSAVGIHVLMDATHVALAPYETKRVGFLIQVPSTHPTGTHLLRFDASGTNLSGAGYLFLHVVAGQDGPSDGGLLPAVDVVDIGAAITDGGTFERTLRVRNQNTTERAYPVRVRAPTGWTMNASTDSLLLPVDTTEELNIQARPGPDAVNGTGFVEIGWEGVHTAVQVSLNVTHANRSDPLVAQVDISAPGGILPFTLGGKRITGFTVRDVGGRGWTGDAQIVATPGFRGEGSTRVSIGPGGSQTLSLMVSAPDAVPGDRGQVGLRIGDTVTMQDFEVMGSFDLAADVDNVRLGPGDVRTVNLTIANTGETHWQGSLNITAPLGVSVTGSWDFSIPPGASETRTYAVQALTGAQTGEVQFILHAGKVWRVRVNDALDPGPPLRIGGDRTEVTLGETAIVPVNITIWNDGATFWDGRLAIDAPTFVTVSGDPTYVLPPGGQGAREFNLTLRAGEQARAAVLRFTIPDGDSWEVAIRAPNATTGSIEISLDHSSLSLEPGQRGMVRVSVANRGDVAWTGTLARAPSAGLQLAGDTAPLVLPPGGEQVVDVFVTLAVGTEGVVQFAAGDARATLRIEPPAGDLPIEDEGDDPARLDPAAVLMLTAGGVAVVAGAAAAVPRRWPLAFAGLYARLAGARLLEHPVRRQIRTLVEMAPGITYNEIGRQLALERGVLDHHLTKLTSNGLVSSVPDGQYRRFYAPGSSHPVVRGALDARILAIVRERGETRAAEVAATLGVSRQAMHYHLRRMVREGTIVASRGAGGLVLRASA